MSRMWRCGDVCGCSHIEWDDETLFVGEEYTVETNESWGGEGNVKIDHLAFNDHYTITQYP